MIRMFLLRKQMQGQVTFAGKKNTKIMSNLPDSELGRGRSPLRSPFEMEGEAHGGLESVFTAEGGAREVVESGVLVRHSPEVLEEGERSPLKKRRLVRVSKKVRSLKWALEESRRMILSGEEARQAGIEVSPEEGPWAVVIDEAFPLEVVASKGGLEDDPLKAKDVLVDGLVVWSPNKMAQARGESTNARVEVVGSFLAGQAVRERRGLALSVRVGLGRTSSSWDDNEVFWWQFDIEAQVLKILGDLLLMESRVIRKSATLGQEPVLDCEGQGPRELMMLKFLPNIRRELQDIEEKIRSVDGCSLWAEYRYHASYIMSAEEGQKVIVARKHPEESSIWDHFKARIIETRQEVESQLLQDLAEESVADLTATRDAMFLQRDQATSNVEAPIVAKRDLKSVWCVRLRFLLSRSPSRHMLFKLSRREERLWSFEREAAFDARAIEAFKDEVARLRERVSELEVEL
ncbi:hypothetical protein ACLOJK_008483 [Asimina triloba]